MASGQGLLVLVSGQTALQPWRSQATKYGPGPHGRAFVALVWATAETTLASQMLTYGFFLQSLLASGLMMPLKLCRLIRTPLATCASFGSACIWNLTISSGLRQWRSIPLLQDTRGWQTCFQSVPCLCEFGTGKAMSARIGTSSAVLAPIRPLLLWSQASSRCQTGAGKPAHSTCVCVSSVLAKPCQQSGHMQRGA